MKNALMFALMLNATIFASITPGGYSGYSYTPVPKSLNSGELGYAVRFDLIGGNDFSHSLAVRPVQLLELGLGVSKKPAPAVKIILPFADSLPHSAAFGFFKERFYFTGMLQSSIFSLAIAGIYDTDQRLSVGSVASEIDLKYASLSVENFLYSNRYGVAGTFAIKPIPYFEASTGAAWRSPEYEKDFSLFVAVQAMAPILKTEKDPAMYLDINPVFDHSVSFSESDYNLRFALDLDAVIIAPFDFYIVGGFLTRKDFFDRCYLLWDSESLPIYAAAGMLNSGIFGVQGQAAKKLYNPNPFALDLGYTLGDQKGINAVLQAPLHPQFSGFLSNSLLFAEGGLFLGQNLAAQLNFRQGSENKHLQFGGGYDFERRSIFVELGLQYGFSLSKQISGMEIRLAPNLRHRENSDVYIFDYDVPIYQEGNNGRRLRSFPWRR
jgi:hypothetical protein